MYQLHCCACSPSGCTFWGKKQWSLKKKILLQLAMLVGGPIGISFIAIAAIPAIIIGLPVWVGRRVTQFLIWIVCCTQTCDVRVMLCISDGLALSPVWAQ